MCIIALPLARPITNSSRNPAPPTSSPTFNLAPNETYFRDENAVSTSLRRGGIQAMKTVHSRTRTRSQSPLHSLAPSHSQQSAIQRSAANKATCVDPDHSASSSRRGGWHACFRWRPGPAASAHIKSLARSSALCRAVLFPACSSASSRRGTLAGQ